MVAIAPIDGQYEPADQPTPIENVNYLVLQGSHDSDVSFFAGYRPYCRVRFIAVDPKAWPVAKRVGCEIVRAEMNGLEFDHRVLRPWSRMPGFYADLKAFLDELFKKGLVPQSLIRWEITGIDDEMRALGC